MVRVTQSVFVSLAYRYWNSAWPREENRHIFGAQASSEGVGGNWRLELEAEAAPGQMPSLLPHLNFLKGQLDHRCLWETMPEFSSRPSTPENLALHLAPLAFARPLDQGRWVSFTIYETEHSAFKVFADGETEAEVRVSNLTLTTKADVDRDSGLGIPRAQVTQTVKNLLMPMREPSGLDEAEWGKVLHARISDQIPNLKSLRIDLGRQKYIVVNSKA